jgi:hypothetical protein
MKKLFIVELFHHHECIENPYQYYKKNNFDVKIITTAFVGSNLIKIPQEDIHILKKSNRVKFNSLNIFQKIPYIFKQFFNNITLLKEINTLIKKEKPEYLHITTVETPFAIPLLIYLQFVKTPLILTLHNTNRLKVGFKKYIWFDFLIKFIIKKAKKIVLLAKYLKLKPEYQHKVIYLNNRPITTKTKQKFPKTTFVITGGLNIAEKDNELIFKHFSPLLQKNPKLQFKTQLILLSKVNPEVIKLIKKYKLEKITRMYSEFVEEKEFEKVMLQSHYVILSTKENGIYGKYKISGSYGDAVGFNLPILINEHFAPQYKDKKVIRFNDDNLHEVLKKLIT